MAKQPELVMIAGPNGSGKSTLIGGLQASPELRLPALYINADDIQREEGATHTRRGNSHNTVELRPSTRERT